MNANITIKMYKLQQTATPPSTSGNTSALLIPEYITPPPIMKNTTAINNTKNRFILSLLLSLNSINLC